MTLQFKTGDWVKLRNGRIIGPIKITPCGMIDTGFDETFHGPLGHYDYLVKTSSESMFDVIAIVDAPEVLPEPFERFVKIKPYTSCMMYESADNARTVEGNGKIYRCTVTPIELVKP